MADGPNYGILSPIVPTNRVLSTTTTPATPDAFSQGVDGLLKGLQVGANVKLQKAQTARMNQETDQSAKLFPGVLENQNIALESNKMDLAGKKQASQDMAQLRAASIQGPDQYARILQQQNPAAYQDYQLKTFQTKQAIANLAGQDAKNKKDELANYDGVMDKVGQVARTAMTGVNPEMQQKIWSTGISQLPKSIQMTVPPQYDQAQAMVYSRLAHESAATQTSKNLEASGTDTIKNATALRIIQQRVAGQVQAGMKPDPADVEMQNALKAQLIKDTTPAKTAKGENDSSALYDKAISGQDAITMKSAAESRQTFTQFQSGVQQAQQELKGVPGYALGPAANLTKLPKYNSQVQILKSTLNSLALQAKEIYKLGSGQGFTDADRDFLTEVVGNTAMNKYSIEQILTKMGRIAGLANKASWKTENDIRSNGSKDVYENWKSRNPEPTENTSKPANSPIPSDRIQVKSPDGKIGHIPSSQLQEALKSGYSQVK